MAKSAKERARTVLLNEKDYPFIRSVYVETCRKVRGTDQYDLVLRTDDELGPGDVERIAQLFKGTPGPLSSGYEYCCDLCGGSSYMEFDLSGATIPG